jgi:hypothetical protein
LSKSGLAQNLTEQILDFRGVIYPDFALSKSGLGILGRCGGILIVRRTRTAALLLTGFDGRSEPP